LTMEQITGLYDISDIKRFRFRAKLTRVCPGCGADIVHDFEQEALGYPEVGKMIPLHLWCDECDAEYSIRICVKNVVVGIECDDELCSN